MEQAKGRLTALRRIPSVRRLDDDENDSRSALVCLSPQQLENPRPTHHRDSDGQADTQSRTWWRGARFVICSLRVNGYAFPAIAIATPSDVTCLLPHYHPHTISPPSLQIINVKTVYISYQDTQYARTSDLQGELPCQCASHGLTPNPLSTGYVQWHPCLRNVRTQSAMHASSLMSRPKDDQGRRSDAATLRLVAQRDPDPESRWIRQAATYPYPGA